MKAQLSYQIDKRIWCLHELLLIFIINCNVDN